jgi:hypothetical protein
VGGGVIALFFSPNVWCDEGERWMMTLFGLKDSKKKVADEGEENMFSVLNRHLSSKRSCFPLAYRAKLHTASHILLIATTIKRCVYQQAPRFLYINNRCYSIQ